MQRLEVWECEQWVAGTELGDQRAEQWVHGGGCMWEMPPCVRQPWQWKQYLETGAGILGMQLIQ